MHNNGI